MLVLLSWAAKVVAAVFGAWLGYLAGMMVSYYAVDRGDVGSAAASVIFVPIGVLTCSIAAYAIATVALSPLR